MKKIIDEKFTQLLLDLDINICELCNYHYTQKKCSGCKKKYVNIVVKKLIM